MRVDVLGIAAVSGDGLTVAGHALGGRRARLTLVALALADGPVGAERLASIIWADDQPATWPTALRGTIRALRSALAPAGAAGQQLIATVPSGYCLAPGTQTDVRLALTALRSATELAGQGRHEAALDAAAAAARLSGDQLLPGEDAAWLEPHRRELDAAAIRALEITARSAGALGDHHRAVDAARRAVAANPLGERSHRVLIRALQLAGDRAGAVRAYEECRSLLADQLGVDPDPETVKVYLAALRYGGPGGAARLPLAGSVFFGREADVARLSAAISEPGLVTVSGKGGVGKSRIVLQVAARSAGFPGGKLWVPVASASKDELVAATAAMTIGLPLGADDAASILAAHLAPLGRTLLVIDGCEAVIDGVASLVSGLLSACPLLSAVVTSRVPLSVDTERLVALEPLPSPADGDSAAFAASSQVQLLADRVRDAGGQLEITEEIVPLIAELCRRCGGLPLALELVAAQLTVMSVPDLLDHLSAPEVAGEYQVREVARSSYALLDEDEAAVFRRFAVLDGQVALPFVRAVVAGASVTPVRVVRILRELTARGLLAVDRSGARWRYHQDDELHGFARELLVAGGEEEPAFSQLAAAVARIVPAEPSTPPAPYLEAIGEVLPAVRSLLGAALEGKLAREAGLELAFRLHRYWAATNVTEGRFWLSRLLADAPEPAGPGGQGGQGGSQSYTAHATYALGYLSYWTGDADAAVRELQAAVGLMHGRPDEYTARALIFLGGLADDQDRVADALDFVRRSIVAAAPFAVDLQVSAAIGMGCVLGERAAAQAAGYAAEAISLCRQSGSAEQLAATLPTAATVCWQVGDLDAARRYVSEGLPMLAGTRRIAHVVLLSAAAGVALADDDPDAAVELGAAADAEASDLGIMRELPLVRSVVARAFLQRGAVAAAARQVLGAIDAASSLSFPFPLAVCLETAALVCLAGAAAREPGGDEPGGDDPGGADPGGADPGSDYPGGDDPGGEPGRGGGPGDVQGGAGGGVAGQRAAAATLLAAAAAIRERGDRPGPPSLRGAVAAARAALPAGQPAAPAAAAALAVTALTAAARQPARLASQRGTAGRRGVHQVR